jgi:hypothetical protein
MKEGERDGLVARIRQVRRVSPASFLSLGGETSADASRVQSLEARIAHLEGLLEGLQDSVHREAHRQSRRITDLEARLEPTTLAAALSKDARERGL